MGFAKRSIEDKIVLVYETGGIFLDKEQAVQMLESLKNKEVEEIFVAKQDFMAFREFLVKRDDFKHFRGIAQRGGDVIFRYMDEARS